MLRVCLVTVLGRGTCSSAREVRGQLRHPWSLTGLCLFLSKTLNNCKPQNAEILVYSYSIFYRVVAFMTNLNAGVLLWFQEPFLFRDQAHSLLHCGYFFCLGRVCSHAHLWNFVLNLWSCKARGCWGGLWIAHSQMGLSRSYVWRWWERKCCFCYFTTTPCGPMQQPAVSSRPSC